MKKKILLVLSILILTLCLSGCDAVDNTSTMTAYTSVYPVEYILDNLYGENIAIYSIYPDGIGYESYNLTDKQLTDYSKGDLYIYNGSIQKEKDYAVKLLNKNKKIKVIDAALGMSLTDEVDQTWLNPANCLMMASNIKKGLKEYINESIEIKKIEDNYETLKLKLSEIEAELKAIAVNADNNTLVVSSDIFKYLEKYGFEVISLEDNENLTDKTIADVKKMLANKQISYIFIKNNEDESELIKSLRESYGVQVVKLNTLSTLSASDRKDKKDYITITNDNINSIKLEVNN